MIRNFIPRELYVRLFLYLALAVTLIIAVFSFFLTRQQTHNAINEIDRVTLQRVSQIRDNADYTLQKMKMYAGRLAQDQDSNAWLTASSEDYWTYKRMEQNVNDFIGIEPFFHAVFMVNPSINRVYSSLEGVKYMDKFSDQELLQLSSSDQARNLTLLNISRSGHEYLLLCMPVAKSRVIVLLDRVKLEQFLIQTDPEQMSNVLIVNQDGEVMLGRKSDDTTKAVIAKMSQDEGPSIIRLEGDEWSIRRMDLGAQSWRIYHMTPLEALHRSVTQTQWSMVLSFLLLLLIIWVILFWYSRVNFKPIGSLVRTMQEKLGQEATTASPAEAAHIITTGIESMVQRIEQLDRSIKDSRYLVKEENLRQWILSGSLTDTIKRQLSETVPVLHADAVYLAVVRIETYAAFCEKYDFPSRKLMKYAMANITSEIMEHTEVIGEVVDFGADHVVLVMDARSEQSVIVDMLEKLRNNIDKYLQFTVVAAVSDLKAPEESLLTAYEVILEASMLKFLDGVDRVYSEQDLTLYEDTIRTEMDEEIVKELIQSVRLGNQAMVQNDLKQLTDYMRGMTYAECKLQLTHLIYELMKSFKQLDTAKGMEGIQHTLDKFQHLNGAIRWIEDFLHGVMEDLKLRSTYNRKEEIATEAVQYVMNNLHNPMLSTDMIADHTSVSVSYVRQVFKEWMDCTLSDFILNQRMERVKVLLATTESTVAEIAEQTGFQSKSHFFTAFKKATGLTPVQYRSQSLE